MEANILPYLAPAVQESQSQDSFQYLLARFSKRANAAKEAALAKEAAAKQAAAQAHAAAATAAAEAAEEQPELVVPKAALDAAAAAVAAATAQVEEAQLPSMNGKEAEVEDMGVLPDLVCGSALGAGLVTGGRSGPADLLAVAAAALGAHPILPIAAAGACQQQKELAAPDCSEQTAAPAVDA